MTEPAAEDGTSARPVPFISRVRIKNYKSIASCAPHGTVVAAVNEDPEDFTGSVKFSTLLRGKVFGTGKLFGLSCAPALTFSPGVWRALLAEVRR